MTREQQDKLFEQLQEVTIHSMTIAEHSIYDRKLTNEVANTIREEYSKGDSSYKLLAKKYNVSMSIIQKIIQGLTYNIDGKYIGRPSQNISLRKLTNEVANTIREEYSKGDSTYKLLAKKYNVSYGTILKIIQGLSYKSE